MSQADVDAIKATLGNIERILTIDPTNGPGGIVGDVSRANAAIAAVATSAQATSDAIRATLANIEQLLTVDPSVVKGGIRGQLESVAATLTAIQATLPTQTGGAGITAGQVADELAKRLTS